MRLYDTCHISGFWSVRQVLTLSLSQLVTYFSRRYIHGYIETPTSSLES